MVTGYDKTVIKHHLRYEISLPGYDIRLLSSKQQHSSYDAWLPGTIHQHWGTIQYYSGYDIRLPRTIIHCSWANFLYPVLEFALKLIPRSRNGPIFFILRSKKFVN